MSFDRYDLDYVGRLTVKKTADQTVNNSTTLVSDNELKFIALANAIYIVQLFLRINLKANSDFKYAFSVPAGAAARGNSATASTVFVSGALGGESDLTSARNCTGTVDALTPFTPVAAWIIMGATPGSVILQWAQNTQAAEDTILLAGSMMHVTRVV